LSDPILVEVTRGPKVESRHHGALVVCDSSGARLAAIGDVVQAVFPRSAIKGLQALPLVETGAADRYGLTDAEIALACASHSGEPDHVATAAGMLAKAGRDATCLECGVHWPREPHGYKLAARGEAPGQLHNNCSGKHSGFICTACAAGEDPKGYIGFDHPVQVRIRDVLQDICDTRLDRSGAGIDGCSIPTYAIPLDGLATAFARFGSGERLSSDRKLAAARIRAAVAASPFHVAGSGRFDTEVMQLLGAQVFVKTGAEGVHCAALPSLGLGVALKCADGAARAAQALMAAAIIGLLDLDITRVKPLRNLATPTLRNWNGIEVGRQRFVGLPADWVARLQG
jgi:L-asparaginase II